MDETRQALDARIRDSFRRQRVMDVFGAELTRVAPGEVEIAMDFREDLTQQHGFLHAGIVATLLDSACGYAAYTLMSPQDDVVAVEFKTNFLRPALGKRLRVLGRVIRSGRSLTACSGDAYMLRDGAEVHVAVMQSTIMNVRDRHAAPEEPT
jgi:uncharacterized protein (TIGR00369 family)